MWRVAAALLLLALLPGCQGRPGTRPSARYATAAAVVDGTVYIVGGCERGALKDTTVATVEAYAPGARKWTRCAPMPTARSFAAVAAFDGKVYVFGGLDAAGKALDTTEVYDPDEDTWSALPGMGMARSRLAAVRHMYIGIVVIGGLDVSEKNVSKARIFLPRENQSRERNTWGEWVDLHSPRHGFSLVDADDGTERVFAVGGFDETGPLATVEMFGVGTIKVLGEDGKPRWQNACSTDNSTGKVTKLDKDFQGYDWWPCPPLKEARGFLGLAAIGKRIHAVGGRCPAIPRTEVLDMDDVAAGWKRAAPLPKDLCRFSLVEWEGHLLAFGGETDFGKSINTEVLEYDPSVDKWTVR